MSGVQLPAPQRQRAVVETQREFSQGVVYGIIVFLKVPVVVEIYDGVVVTADCIKLNI